MTELEKLLQKAENKQGFDYEGDCTYRVHITTVKQLIEEAYRQGKEDALCNL